MKCKLLGKLKTREGCSETPSFVIGVKSSTPRLSNLLSGCQNVDQAPSLNKVYVRKTDIPSTSFGPVVCRRRTLVDKEGETRQQNTEDSFLRCVWS